jgi:SprT protein
MDKFSDIIKPITTAQRLAITERTNEYFQRAAVLFDTRLKSVEITFNLKGRVAGMYRLSRYKREIRYNPYIFAKYFDDNFNTTIPHEVAHYITDIIYGLRNIKPHGKEWKAVMHAFEADASVTANYDLSGIPVKKQKLFTYQCECRDHQLTTVRHKRIVKNSARYYCNHCKQSLRFKKQQQQAA